MLGDCPIVAFVGTQNAPRAKTFYGQTLGLRLVSEDPFALAFDANGTMLRVAIVPEVRAAGYTVLGWKVPDIKQSVAELKSKGVHFGKYEGLDQDAEGIWRSPAGARIAWFADPDGNTLSLTEFGEMKI